MSLLTAMAAVAAICEELPGIERGYPEPGQLVSDLPAVMPITSDGQVLPGDMEGTHDVLIHQITFHLFVAPASADLEALATAADLMGRIVARINRRDATDDPRLADFFDVRVTSYTTAFAPTAGDTDYFGGRFIVTIQEPCYDDAFDEE